MVGATQAGMSVVPLPMFLGRSADGLVQLLVLPPQPFSGIWVIGHPDVWSSPKLHAFCDIQINHCKLHSHQFVA
jgi:DNA-binding transcriptional LysR family regulator